MKYLYQERLKKKPKEELERIEDIYEIYIIFEIYIICYKYIYYIIYNILKDIHGAAEEALENQREEEQIERRTRDNK